MSYPTFFHRVIGWKPEADKKSNQRRYMNRSCVFLSIIFAVEIWSSTHFAYDSDWLNGLGFGLLLWAVFFFCLTVLFMPFRDRSDFRVSPRRLLYDTMVSALFMIVSFGMVFRFLGISDSPEGISASPVDALYFSIITFSTLGYGDFSPLPSTRLLAAFEALIGNLHLGFIVGSVMAALGRDS